MNQNRKELDQQCPCFSSIESSVVGDGPGGHIWARAWPNIVKKPGPGYEK